MAGKESRQACYMCCCPVLALGCLLTIILIPMSFSKIEYYEAGLRQQKSSGRLSYDKVYDAGNYMIGPDFEFKKFPINLQLFNQRVAVWSKSGGDDAGATINLDISFQYRIRSADIPQLYQKVAMSYEPLVVTYALDAIKNTAPLYGVDQYLTQRSIIEANFKLNVTNALATDMYVDVVDLQLRRIILSPDYESTKLNAALQVEQNQKEFYVQNKTIIEEETALEVLQIDNQAVQVANAAVADANQIKDTAVYQAKQLVEERRSAGLKYMLTEIGLTSDEHKASLDYITTLINNKANIVPYINMGPQSLQTQVS